MASRISLVYLKSAAKVIAGIFVASVLLTPIAGFAQIQSAAQNTQAVAQAAGISGGSDLITIIGRIINVFLGLLGVVFLVLFLYAGYQWMTAAGDAEKVKKAQATLRNAVIGLVIIASSWAIVAFVMNALTGATSDGLGGVGGAGGAGGFGSLRGASGSLGNGIIEMHLPPRDATGVPRNTSIIITFKEPMNPASFIAGWTDATSGTTQGLNADVIKIYRTSAGDSSALASDKARVRYTSDFKTFVIKPTEYLGSPTAKVGYTVSLAGGKSGVLKKDGSAAFAGSFGSGYNWQFEVSTVVDLTPPTVDAATPIAFGSYARNVLIQMTFSKAIDPTTVSGYTTNLEVRAGDGTSVGATVPGQFRISNQYRTVEFVPDLKCGTNSCGVDVFCLPGSKTVQVVAHAAHIDPTLGAPQAALTTSGYDGVVDMVGNSLDGNGKNGAEGPPTDDYSWTFGTTDLLKLSPPQVVNTIPGIGSGKSSNVPLDQPVTAQFDSILQASTLTTDNARIRAAGPGETNPDTFWWSVSQKLLDASGADISSSTSTAAVPVSSAVVISHRPYLPSGTDPTKLNYYDPSILSGVQDQYQNCFNPARVCGTGSGVNCCNGQPQDGACTFKP